MKNLISKWESETPKKKNLLTRLIDNFKIKNLIILSEENPELVEPTKCIILCREHYEAKKQNLKNKKYSISSYRSSIPKIWCEVCSPSDYGDLMKKE